MKIKAIYTDNIPGDEAYRSKRWTMEITEDLAPGDTILGTSHQLFEAAKNAVDREIEAARIGSVKDATNGQQQPPTHTPRGQEPPPNWDQTPPAGNQTDKRGFLELVSQKPMSGKNGPFTSYGCKIDGAWINTIDESLGQLALSLQGRQVVFTTKQNGKYTNLASIGPAQ